MIDISVLKRKNFEPEEFIKSVTASTEGIDNNIYDKEVLDNMICTADKMQEIRDKLKSPIKINSGYRCLKLNRRIGSKDTSQHVKGQAIDFICPRFGTPKQIVEFLEDEGVEVDQCLLEFDRWVHLSIRSKENRNQFGEISSKGFRLLRG